MRTLKSGVKVSEKEPPKKKYKEDDPPRSSPANDQTKNIGIKINEPNNSKIAGQQRPSQSTKDFDITSNEHVNSKNHSQLWVSQSSMSASKC